MILGFLTVKYFIIFFASIAIVNDLPLLVLVCQTTTVSFFVGSCLIRFDDLFMAKNC
jgi:hypothetical protein